MSIWMVISEWTKREVTIKIMWKQKFHEDKESNGKTKEDDNEQNEAYPLLYRGTVR